MKIQACRKPPLEAPIQSFTFNSHFDLLRCLYICHTNSFQATICFFKSVFFRFLFLTPHPCSLTYTYLYQSSILKSSQKATANKTCNILLSFGILPPKAQSICLLFSLCFHHCPVSPQHSRIHYRCTDELDFDSMGYKQGYGNHPSIAVLDNKYAVIVLRGIIPHSEQHKNRIIPSCRGNTTLTLASFPANSEIHSAPCIFLVICLKVDWIFLPKMTVQLLLQRRYIQRLICNILIDKYTQIITRYYRNTITIY